MGYGAVGGQSGLPSQLTGRLRILPGNILFSPYGYKKSHMYALVCLIDYIMCCRMKAADVRCETVSRARKVRP